jgi:hypothetical protein
MQKPTRPGHSKLSVLGSTGSKKAIGRAQVGLYLGTYVRREVRVPGRASAQRKGVARAGGIPAAIAEQVLAALSALLVYVGGERLARVA